MIENAMVIGDYDTRPEMTDADFRDRVDDYEEQLCNDRLESLIEELENSDFTRRVVAVMLSDSREKFSEIKNLFDDAVTRYARYLADKE
jgi:hypothetical protein